MSNAKAATYEVRYDMQNDFSIGNERLLTAEITPPLKPEADFENLILTRAIGGLIRVALVNVHYLPLSTVVDMFYRDEYLGTEGETRGEDNIREDLEALFRLSLSPCTASDVAISQVYS